MVDRARGRRKRLVRSRLSLGRGPRYKRIMDSPLLRAAHDPRLAARVTARWRLDYTAGPPGAPPHVRAASGVAAVGPYLAVVQDDANWLALLDVAARAVHAVPLPPGPGGHRLFDDRVAPKRLKLDLEACVALPGEPVALAFGSGSLPPRERVVMLRLERDRPALADVLIKDAAPLYAALRAALDPGGGELNLEGAAVVGDRLRLFHRGNTAVRQPGAPAGASCDVSLAALRAWLDGAAPPPTPANPVRYDLGRLAGVPLTLTDATPAPGGLVFLAAAEDSPDAVRDGPVTGSVLGVLDAGGARWAPLCAADGRPLAIKAEGVALDPGGRVARVVIDPDDPDQPAELLTVALSGPWW